MLETETAACPMSFRPLFCRTTRDAAIPTGVLEEDVCRAWYWVGVRPANSSVYWPTTDRIWAKEPEVGSGGNNCTSGRKHPDCDHRRTLSISHFSRSLAVGCQLPVQQSGAVREDHCGGFKFTTGENHPVEREQCFLSDRIVLNDEAKGLNPKFLSHWWMYGNWIGGGGRVRNRSSAILTVALS